MQPTATQADLPSTHDISMYIHNTFIDFFKEFKVKMQSLATGHISTTTDLWSVDQTKAAFLGLMVHWIHVNEITNAWTLSSQVIAFRGISGPHSGHNLGRYFVGLCEHAGIITAGSSKVCVVCLILKFKSIILI
ncbi:hypothetical protein PAXRUDRAFT_163528 [Paxillus rubicundulus Ve08.2h10]|uniref:Uncharacterized protein n=1 Tax=Paxillus rubicundulus Ve08.2h10 TaxID=930991 RepID=A0A0D0DK88_9AGAM|nr:hypothetical protein PAXRUDRAFT_163528 [Paxillus rubicundulus Ve08.2h10]